MNNWQDLRHYIENWVVSSQSMQSDQQSLLGIIDALARMGIAFPSGEIASSNLRTSIKYLKIAIINEDVDEINRTLRMVTGLSNQDLRIELGSARIEGISVRRQPDGRYQITITKHQLNRIQARTKSIFDFQEVENDD